MNDARTMLILDRDVLVPRGRAGDVLIFHHAKPRPPRTIRPFVKIVPH